MCFLGRCLWDSDELLAWTCLKATLQPAGPIAKEAAVGTRFGGLLLLVVLPS